MPSLIDSRALSDAILDLYKNVANTLFVFVDPKVGDNPGANNQDNFFNLLSALFEAYKISQMKRFHAVSSLSEIEEEGQISDLITLLQIISSSITRPYMHFLSPLDSGDSCEMTLCQRSKSLPPLNMFPRFSTRNDIAVVE